MSHNPEHNSLFVPPSIQDHRQGMLTAAAVLVLYGDYQNSRSADVYRLIKVVGQKLRGSLGENDLCLIFRHFPQAQVHAQAYRAAEAAEAAATQGQFWQMHEMLFNHSQALEDGYLVEYANHLELDIPHFLQDLSKQVYVDRINADIKSGSRSGVTIAPALFINDIRYRDRWNIDRLTSTIVNTTH